MEEVFKGTPFSTAELFATDLEEKSLLSVVPTGDPNRPPCVVIILQLHT